MTKNDYMKKIIEVCLFLDESAEIIYNNLVLNVSDKDLKLFWEKMHEEEKTHISWWKSLLDFADKGAIPQIFDNPEIIFQELSLKKKKIKTLLTQSLKPLPIVDQFLIAYNLEFYILHSAFGTLWNLVEIIDPEKTSPEQEYDNHITDFINAMRKFGVSESELEILGEALDHLWNTIKEITHKANFDRLTNILNRKALMDSMTILAYLAKRNLLTSGVLFIDIDKFKLINDQYGHQKGDHVLRSVAQIILSNTRRSDILGRYGGEEFLLFLPEIEPSSMSSFTEKIRYSVEDKMKSEIPVTISIGAVSKSISGDVEKELNNLIKKADELLYRAKAGGRNRVITELIT